MSQEIRIKRVNCALKLCTESQGVALKHMFHLQEESIISSKNPCADRRNTFPLIRLSTF